MRYLCLICAGNATEQMTEADAARHIEDYRAFLEDIQASGHYLGCNRLQPATSAVTVRVRNGKVSTTDGPWVETKEHLGGYFLIEARDRNEAIGIAARIPGASIGCVEVRPVAEDALTLEILGIAETGRI